VSPSSRIITRRPPRAAGTQTQADIFYGGWVLNFRKFASSRRPPSPSSPQTTSEKALQGVKKTVALRRSKFSSKFPQKSVNSGSPHQSQISHVICQLVNQSVSHSSVTSATWPPGFVGHVGHVGHDHPAPRPRPLLLAYFLVGSSFPLLPVSYQFRINFVSISYQFRCSCGLVSNRWPRENTL